jgi:hypothetical protein
VACNGELHLQFQPFHSCTCPSPSRPLSGGLAIAVAAYVPVATASYGARGPCRRKIVWPISTLADKVICRPCSSLFSLHTHENALS